MSPNTESVKEEPKRVSPDTTTRVLSSSSSSSSTISGEDDTEDENKQDALRQETTTISSSNTTVMMMTASMPPPKRRRSQRNTQRIVLPHKTSLAYRRLDQLFFQEEEQQHHDSDNNNKRTPRSQQQQACSSPQQQQQLLRFLQNKTFVPIHSYKLYQVHTAPNIYVIPNFLTQTEIQHLFEKHIAKRRFQRSFVDQVPTSTTSPSSSSATADADNNSSSSNSNSNETTQATTTATTIRTAYDTSHRTSTFLSFTKNHDAKITAIETRAAQLLGFLGTSTQVECLQLVRYQPNQFFGLHHDLGDYNPDTGHVALPPKSYWSKRRLVTLFCYLNDLSLSSSLSDVDTDDDDRSSAAGGGGGATYFPYADHLRVQPVAGTAVLFSNITADGMPDPRTVHAGEAVTPPPPRATASSSNRFIKYGLNIWICEE